ncbi:MAG: bifunctional (p)ppGpp synthetase/guanosine-3',5'-bis(diphosphate) 3'-pyrophosphohydrolase [Chlorobi bacterium]|nr:bifunctional (p)ppGpp synthetase/guanosine-3',5'-bis(diphosphate) 3'-pyrophosphohydrolase [Chlorobiota bacterium]
MEDFYTKEEQKEIDLQLRELINSCQKCKNAENEKLIIKAFKLADRAHKGVRRKSGEPYIFHPIAVARIAAREIGLGTKGVVAALLHDVVEDTDYTVEDIERMFNPKIASIVDGLTKLEGIFLQSESVQIENFRKLLLSMVEDVRVILIKLADRLHNMRTLDSMPENKRLKIAGETLYFYAPLAHRLGLYAIKTELEDLSFKYEHPGIYKEISKKVVAGSLKQLNQINEFAEPIKERLADEGYEFEIKGRPKSIYSIWTKMQKKDLPFEEIYDLLAIRIVFKPLPGMNEKTQCWAIYSMITDIYKPKPDRLRDWISVPKANGYEALHATFMSSSGNWVEVQIRSVRMDEIAEKGFAAHWKYKENRDKESELDNWLKKIRELLENPDDDSIEFLDDFKLNLFASEIVVFTPKGDKITLPNGATALDFAFEIHTDLGYRCIGAKVNYKLVPLSHKLKTGDQVEILTSKKQKPKWEWFDFVTTAKAKTRIKQAFRKERKKFIRKGEKILESYLNEKKLAINSKILKKLQHHYNVKNKEELYFNIGKGIIDLKNASKVLSDKPYNKWVRYWKLSFGKGKDQDKAAPKVDKKKTLLLTDDKEQHNYTIANCCNPIPGDDVIAYQDDDDQLVLHSRKCKTAIKLMSSHGDRIVPAQWESQKILSYIALIKITGIDSLGIVSKLTKVISDDQNVNMRSIHIDSHDGIFEGSIYLYIHHTRDLNNLILKLMKIKGIHTVIRQERLNE